MALSRSVSATLEALLAVVMFRVASLLASSKLISRSLPAVVAVPAPSRVRFRLTRVSAPLIPSASVPPVTSLTDFRVSAWPWARVRFSAEGPVTSTLSSVTAVTSVSDATLMPAAPGLFRYRFSTPVTFGRTAPVPYSFRVSLPAPPVMTSAAVAVAAVPVLSPMKVSLPEVPVRLSILAVSEPVYPNRKPMPVNELREVWWAVSAPPHHFPTSSRAKQLPKTTIGV